MTQMNFAVAFAALPKIAPDTKTCVRWNPKRNRYELVVGGRVTAHCSRLKMSIAKYRDEFLTEVNAVRVIQKRMDAKEESKG